MVLTIAIKIISSCPFSEALSGVRAYGRNHSARTECKAAVPRCGRPSAQDTVEAG